MFQILFTIIGSNLRLKHALEFFLIIYLLRKMCDSRFILIAITSIKTCLINNFKIKNYLNIFKNSLVSDWHSNL